MENKQEFSQGEGVSEKKDPLLEEEAKILLERIKTIENCVKDKRIRNIPRFEEDEDFQKKILFIQNIIGGIKELISEFSKETNIIVKHNLFLDKIGNAEAMILLSLERLEKENKGKSTSDKGQKAVNLIFSEINKLYDYFQEINENPDYFIYEIGTVWNYEEKKVA